MSRGFRNNNPGNIRRAGVRYKGEVKSADPAFKAFSAMEWGVRAIFMVLHSYRVKHGLTTVKAMIARYAPANENDTSAYVRFVCRIAKMTPDTELDTLSPTAMIPLVSAMVRMENGRHLLPATIEKGWKLFKGE